ncbi:methyltransferase [Ectopseudomonas mendocina]|uniref:Methyltransferase n=1 Tax=Ectopseudomonas mendocina TaxID=300 RepID=A0ABZ2RIE7_ECTME
MHSHAMPDHDTHSVLSGAAIQQRFSALDQFLTEHQALWRPRPFVHHPNLPWESRHPELGHWLRQQSLEHAEAAHNQPHLLRGAPDPFTQLAAHAARLSQIGAHPHTAAMAYPARLSNGVPGRKWQQIDAFSRSLSFAHAPTHWLDWCSGKGHLGRLLAREGARLTCLEHDAQLVASGQQLSDKLAIHAQHIQQDVLASNAASRLSAEHTPVALHACGELHTRLLQLASESRCQQLAVAPCCYNRISTPLYQALSQPAQQSALVLDIDDLGLPLSETVTAGARVRRQRDQSMAWRLGFDLLQRKIRGKNEYLSTPSLPLSYLDKSFEDFCKSLAQLKNLPPLSQQNWPELERLGWQRLAEVRNLELVRNLFRRPLELWLLLDRALYLSEQGYGVKLGTFCSYTESPRNLLMIAERHNNHAH